MRIVFMGTPDFARTILERLVADGHDVCGVFTQPDKPRNRNKVTPSPVKEYALSQNIPVFQPDRKTAIFTGGDPSFVGPAQKGK